MTYFALLNDNYLGTLTLSFAQKIYKNKERARHRFEDGLTFSYCENSNIPWTDRIMEESDSSEASVDHVPIITQEIQQLAQSLNQTNENLYTFQFMLNQYKKLARVAPTIQSEQKKDSFEEELKRISQSIQQLEAKDNTISTNFQEIKEYMKQPLQSPISQLDVAQLNQLILDLKEKLASQDNRCASLTERNVRLEADLKAEKEKNLVLNQKLDAEKRAAQVVGRDVQKYVEYAKKLEDEISVFRSEASKKKHLKNTSTQNGEEFGAHDVSSILCKTCIDDDQKDNLQIVVDKVQKLAEQIESQNEHLVEEFRNSKNGPTTIKASSSNALVCPHQHDETTLNHRRLELAEIMAERNSLHVINEQLTEQIDKLQNDVEEREAKYQSLKSKTKVLLGKYKTKSSSTAATEKLKTAKKVLTDLQKLFAVKDKNQTVLMNYFGGQIEIFGRILSAFSGEVYKGPVLNVDAHKKLTIWFTNVHSVSIWCQKEILSLGKEHYLIKADTKPDCDTLSEISTALDQDEERLPIEVLKALQSQTSVIHQTEKNVGELRSVLC